MVNITNPPCCPSLGSAHISLSSLASPREDEMEDKGVQTRRVVRKNRTSLVFQVCVNATRSCLLGLHCSPSLFSFSLPPGPPLLSLSSSHRRTRLSLTYCTVFCQLLKSHTIRLHCTPARHCRRTAPTRHMTTSIVQDWEYVTAGDWRLPHRPTWRDLGGPDPPSTIQL